MVSVLYRSRHDDADLARRVAAGDGAAFAELDARHRKPLQRYARSLLRRSEHDAEDVVQDVLIRAHGALLAGNVPDELRPWLYRLTRNRAIDEVRRARWGDEALDADAAGAAGDREDPEAVLRRKESVRRLVDDLADLPVRQRAALLARELDGQSPEQVAAQLGVSVAAAQMLATRARENLIKTREARDADCAVVRETLLDAHERGVRPPEHALRHVKGCDACRAYQARPAQALQAAAGAQPGARAAAAGGRREAARWRRRKGRGRSGGRGRDRRHRRRRRAQHRHVAVGRSGAVRAQGRQAARRPLRDDGAVLPRGTALVSARVRVPAGAPPAQTTRSVTLACPAGMKVAGFADPEQRFPMSYGLRKDTIFGYSTRGRIVFGSAILPRDYDVTVGLLCRKPDANGSIAVNPRLPQAGEHAGRVCDSSADVYRAPGRAFIGTVYKGQPLSIVRRDRSGEWALVISDMRTKGWMKVSALCG